MFSLDADERVTPELQQEIIGLLQQGPPFDLYAVPRRNYIGNRWIRRGGWYPSAQIKMFKKSIFKWEETTVHPRAFSDRPSGTLRSDLLHFSYRDKADFLAKLDRQTTLEAQKWIADGRRVRLGKALWRTFDRFFRTLVLKQGYREGGLGFFVAWMAGTYQWQAYCKYRRLKAAR